MVLHTASSDASPVDPTASCQYPSPISLQYRHHLSHRQVLDVNPFALRCTPTSKL